MHMYIFVKLYIKSLLGSVSCSHISNMLIELPNAPDHKALFSNRNVDFEQLKGTCLVLRTIKCMKFTDGCLLLQSTPRSSQPDHGLNQPQRAPVLQRDFHFNKDPNSPFFSPSITTHVFKILQVCLHQNHHQLAASCTLW